MSSTRIEHVNPASELWSALATHLSRSGNARWALDGDKPKPDVHCIGALVDDDVIGHISLHIRDIVIPATEWSEDKEGLLTGEDGGRLKETFVNSFNVEEDYRRQGYGRELQLAGLELTRELGGIQMRSWCSLDKPAAYALKLSLGFAAHPAISEAWNGMLVSGVYFVKRV
ncbi:MAG: GNAT family N-acetyltransferase [bacterium]|nr:GNAT family N-acetyltransferase [bacterium]